MKKLLVLSMLVISGAVLLIISNRSGDLQNPGTIVNQVKSVPSPTLTPSPTPYPINRSTNLDEALKSLTPKDYSEEYSELIR